MRDKFSILQVIFYTRPDFVGRCEEVRTSPEIVCISSEKSYTSPWKVHFINTLIHMYNACIYVVDFMFYGGREPDHCTSPNFPHLP
jgi:hypothetical protein